MSPGRDDYWRKMAAPRFRTTTLLEALEARPISRLVDLGCGNGAMLEEIRRYHPTWVLAGIDFSEPQITFNARSLPSFEWYVCDVEQPESIPDCLRHSFQHVVASEVIEHVNDPLALLRSARALASARGQLLISTQSGPLRETERRVGHVRHFERREIASLLEASGWQPIRIWNCGFPFHDLSKWWANLRPDATMARFGERPYGPAENAVCWLLRLAFRFNSQRRGAQLFAVAQASVNV